MMVKANFTFFIDRSAGSTSVFYWQKYQLTITAGQSVISGITSGMDREPIMDIGFRRDEQGGSGGVFVK
ncbi:MAG: hypothetical protein PHC35_03670 [Deltaproteobacteria bacterium]|nr:hypothetical protein [Deltaproteobacteria bacterium]